MKQVEFTPTELKIIKLICRQKNSGDIAEDMGLSKRTIEGYRETILRKTKSKTLVGIVLYAVKHGIHVIR